MAVSGERIKISRENNKRLVNIHCVGEQKQQKWHGEQCDTMREKVFLVRIFLYSDWIQENTNQKKNSVFGLFSRSGN